MVDIWMTNYKKGARKEYKIVKRYKSFGYDIVQRSAGSHSKIDVFAINIKEKRIVLIQSKRTLSENMDYIEPKLKRQLEEENEDLNGQFKVSFVAL